MTEHCRVEYDADGIAWLTLDVAGEATNTVPMAVLAELSELLDDIAARPDLRGMVLRSAKPSGFVAGASNDELAAMGDLDRVASLIDLGQTVTTRLYGLKVPTVAAIHGHCLGSGLELALGCRYRVADEGAATSLGLPDVRLGLHPCYGATARLPSVVGSWRALELMTSGRSVDAAAAKQLGLIDAAVPAESLADTARDFIARDPGRHRPRIWSQMVRFGPARWITYRYLDAQLQRQARPENFPATYAILRLWRRAAGRRLRERVRAERESLLALIRKPSALNLVRTYLLQDRLRREARQLDVTVPQVIHVIGCGAIGAGLAAVLAAHGRQVTVHEENESALEGLHQRAETVFQQRLADPALLEEARGRLQVASGVDTMAEADMVIEAIDEDAEAKRVLYAALEEVLAPDAVIATTTTTLMIDDLASEMRHPERLTGFHCFHPVERMTMVEVVSGSGTGESALARTQALAAALDKLPLRVRSAPGFIVNRLKLPYMLKAAGIYERARREVIDGAALDFGMPIGPLEMADAIGLDVCIAMAEALGRTVPDKLRELVDAGHTGMASGKGFHDWKHGRRVSASVPPGGEQDFPSLARELINPIVEEAVRCSEEGLVADDDMVDVAALFGAGFPAYTGGPLTLRRVWGMDTPLYTPRKRRNTL
ncbi:3-hydroxyacyl-CoA dehydrogenase NAD-binding domain-containing protein [Aquisalimonas sp. APHAB1-3]|uniref:3-hydroxyacyl-CoA dehydrogenase NAD-binding domain-containing protein n=1 Tax=Aquisalimonas sp. APHAB1-3 TaxID=3402080 RepID=UPI003AAB905F